MKILLSRSSFFSALLPSYHGFNLLFLIITNQLLAFYADAAPDYSRNDINNFNEDAPGLTRDNLLRSPEKWRELLENAGKVPDIENVPPVAENESHDENQNNHDDQEDHDQPEYETESYEEIGDRLNCDNPWFWNAFRCTWVDWKRRHVTSRTKRNAATSFCIIGSVLSLVLFWFCCLYCSYALKMRNRLKLQKLREKYEPGRLELPNGKVAKYEPTVEEVKAYEALVKAIIIQEISLMV